MITVLHVEVYKKYGGDDDGFYHCATPAEKAIFLGHKHWSLIETLLQDLSIIKNGLASVSFINSTDETLNENCYNEEAIQAIKSLLK